MKTQIFGREKKDMKLALCLAFFFAYPFSGPSVTRSSHLPFTVTKITDDEGFEVCTGVGSISNPRTSLFYVNKPFEIVSGKDYETSVGYWRYLDKLTDHDSSGDEGTCFWDATREQADKDLKDMAEEYSKDSSHQPVEIRRTAYVYQYGDEKRSPD
jgi:hypothetical protein